MYNFSEGHEVFLIESEVTSSQSRSKYRILNERVKGMEIIRDTNFININLKYADLVEKLYKLQLKSKNIGFFNAFI